MEEHILGNEQADRLADLAAAAVAVTDQNLTRPVIKYTHLVRKIQARLATIVCNLQR